MAYTHVLRPLKIGNTEIRNRIVRAAHSTRLGGGTMTEDLIAYHELRAKGGVGLTILEILGVDQSSPSYISWSQHTEDGYRRLVDRVRPLGMTLFQQLWHGGHHAAPADGSPPWSASDIPSPMANTVPQAMTKAMIDGIVEAYAKFARKCEDVGLEGVEVHGAHGYLPSQFLSGVFNKREDDYGGSLENRARFFIEVMTAIRSTVSKNVAVGVRVGDDLALHGAGAEDYLYVVRTLEENGVIDFVDVSLGNYQVFPLMMAGMHEPAGYELPTSVPITRKVKSPTIVTGRFRTLEEADQVIRSGDADMVSMVRALIADPDIVKKSMAGSPEQVRPCIGCNQGCIGSTLAGGRFGCAVNPGAGFEASRGDQMLKAVEVPKNVLIVGGGPAGMEAARVAALRGHKVVLAEAEPQLGGALKLACRAPTRRGIWDIAVWLEQEVYRLGVDVRLSTYMDLDAVVAHRADYNLIATGSLPRMDGIQQSNPSVPIKGMEQPHVLSSNDFFYKLRQAYGKSAVVIDDTGHYEAVGVAEYLVSQGVAVTFVTRHISFAARVETALMAEPALRRISQLGQFDVRTRTHAIEIKTASVIVAPTYAAEGTNLTTEVPADLVIFVSPNRSNRELFDELVAEGLHARVIGDANAPRFIDRATKDGHFCAAEI
jgi:2,4-dienoyl-CoA reductase-like NADH-dependent reductase (Old Yellow Enzyme family)/thioredoxin reductase